MMNAASCSQEYESEEDSTEWCDVVTVFWDINGFPVPYGVDAGSICRDIIKGLQAFKHSGPFTIEVFGLLTHVPTDVLRALSSYGIILKNVPFDFTGIINQWISVNTPPANLLVFTPYYSETSYKFLTSSSQQGYNITVTFHYSEWWDLCYGAGETDDTGSETDDTGSETDDTGSETDDTDDSWFCSVSHEMSGKSIDDLITHLSQEHELKPTEIVAGVTVFWDINSYPVPFCCEARHVCLTIKNLLEKYYYGPFTIYAIGLLTRVPADVLRALSSSGIILKNVPFDFTDIINQWISVNPPPAETLVFSPYSKTYDKIVASRKDQGYNIAVSQYNYSVWEFLVLDPVLDREDYLTLWEEAGKSSVTAEHAASWYSSESHDISGKGFENFMTHLSQEHVQEEPTEIVAAVTVFWDINAFPLPLCFEARHVCLHINHYLEGRGYSGNFTINAIGLLTRIPADVLRALSSSGIILKNVAFDFTDIMNQWISVNPPPANTLVLSPYDSETFAKFVAPLKEQGYNIMVPQLNYSDWEQFCLEASETLKEEDKCSETDSSWVCSLCQDISGKSFENFLTHLYQKHFHEELMKKRMKEKREAFEAGGEAPLDSRPDTVWVERLSVLAAPSECHEKTLVSEAGKRSVTGEHGASWYSSESHDISGKGFEISMTHLSQEHVQEEPTEIVAAVKVFWDINAFPVPLCCEARQVCLRIKQHLEGRGYSGNFTINAAGLLTRIPAGTLRALWSNGIILKHVPFDFTDIMNQWISVNPPPANTLVLSPYYSETFANFVAPLKEQGYNIMVPQHNYSDWEQFCLEETLKEEDKCSETDSSWVCSLCQDISGKSFENFMTHLYQEHVHEELMKKRMKEKREAFEAGGEAPLDSRPDTVWVERLSVLAAPSECHEKTLVSEAGKRSVTGEHAASWYSSESHDISGKGFEISMTHLSQEHVQEEPTEIVAAVKVFWDINAFPVPLCCEARQVCLRIKQHLEGRGYSGNFTINAAGLLTRIPAGTLRALWSNGIILKHVPFDFTDIMNQWISVNPPPANTLVLCPYYSETFANFVAPLKEQGYNIMVPQHNYSDWEQFCLEASETLKEEDKCSETDSSWVCSLCQDISGKSFENFMTHLYQEHVHEELMKKRMKEKREAFEAGGEAPLDSRPDTVWVERLSVLAAPSECHEKEEAVEALFKKQRKARMPQKMKLKRRIKKAFEAGDEALMNTMSDKGCHEKKQRKAKMKPKMKMKWRIKR